MDQELWIQREGRHQAQIGLDTGSDPIQQPACQMFTKNPDFFGKNLHCHIDSTVAIESS